MGDPSIGAPAPDFELDDLEGRRHRLSEARGRVLILNFWSAECPWSERADEILVPLVSKSGDSVILWPIASNATETVGQIKTEADERGLGLILLDPDHAVADLYGALTTPHLFVIDSAGVLRFKGAPDDVNWQVAEPTRSYLLPAVEAAKQGQSPDPAETPAHGCTIIRFSDMGSAPPTASR